jgi:DNA-binding MarR family transcriptional regulator
MESTTSSESAPAPLGKPDYERLSNFRYGLRHFLRASEEICRRQGLTPLQYQLLLHVRGFQGRDWASIGELAERLQAKHHGVVSLIDRCAKLQWVTRRPGRLDRRVVEIHLLPAGEALVERVAQSHRNELHRLLEVLSCAQSGSAESGCDAHPPQCPEPSKPRRE